MVVGRYCKIFLSHKEVVKFPIILPCIIKCKHVRALLQCYAHKYQVKLMIKIT